jgi:hypothetical protein
MNSLPMTLHIRLLMKRRPTYIAFILAHSLMHVFLVAIAVMLPLELHAAMLAQDKLRSRIRWSCGGCCGR